MRQGTAQPISVSFVSFVAVLLFFFYFFPFFPLFLSLSSLSFFFFFDFYTLHFKTKINRRKNMALFFLFSAMDLQMMGGRCSVVVLGQESSRCRIKNKMKIIFKKKQQGKEELKKKIKREERTRPGGR